MRRHLTHGAEKQRPTRFKAMPGRSPRGMRQRNTIDRLTAIRDAKIPPDGFTERCSRQKLRDRQLADRENEARLEQGEFGGEPPGAAGDFIRSGNAIAPAFFFTWKAPVARALATLKLSI